MYLGNLLKPLFTEKQPMTLWNKHVLLFSVRSKMIHRLMYVYLAFCTFFKTSNLSWRFVHCIICIQKFLEVCTITFGMIDLTCMGEQKCVFLLFSFS